MPGGYSVRICTELPAEIDTVSVFMVSDAVSALVVTQPVVGGNFVSTEGTASMFRMIDT